MIDTHTHTTYSHDGKGKMTAMIEKAIKLGLEYYAITDHLDKDYLYCIPRYKLIRQLDDKKQFEAMLECRAKYEGKIKLGLGIEVGYAAKAVPDIQKVLSRHEYDYIINSIHSVNGADAYFSGYFNGKTRDEAYRPYFENVLESLDAPYRYETIAHIGYVIQHYEEWRFAFVVSSLDNIFHAVELHGRKESNDPLVVTVGKLIEFFHRYALDGCLPCFTRL